MATKPLYKKYTLSRNVIAIQANITDAMRELGRSIESKEKDGFIVYFDDGTKDWCPKSEFEIYYKPSGSFYERLAIELEQIKERLTKLNNFMMSRQYRQLSDVEQSMCVRQFTTMHDYHDAVADRIDYYSDFVISRDDESQKNK